MGNLKSVTLPDGKNISYLIDADNRRFAKQVDGSNTNIYAYKNQLQIVYSRNLQAGTTSYFIYGSKLNVPEYMIQGSQKYKIVSDQIGSVRLVVNANTGAIAQRIDYDTFGKVINDTSPGFQPFGFAGGLYDPDTGLVRFGARDYDPEIGRWTSKDPILFNGGDTNLYGYVLNDPVNMIDPNGRFGLAGASYGFIAGAIGGYITTGSLYGTLGGGLAGAAVGFVNPFGAYAGGVAASLAGQFVGNVLTDRPYLNINLGAAAFAGFGAGIGSTAARGLMCGAGASAAIEGATTGIFEAFGGTLDQTRNFGPLFSTPQ